MEMFFLAGGENNAVFRLHQTIQIADLVAFGRNTVPAPALNRSECSFDKCIRNVVKNLTSFQTIDQRAHRDIQVAGNILCGGNNVTMQPSIFELIILLFDQVVRFDAAYIVEKRRVFLVGIIFQKNLCAAP